jgi:hypothetical protein
MRIVGQESPYQEVGRFNGVTIMIAVEEIKPGCFRIVMDKPEERLVVKVAAEFGITRVAAMTAILYRGYTSLSRQLRGDKDDEQESHGCPHSG